MMEKASRKIRTREQIIADLSINYLKRFILQCGFAADKPQDGYDR
ncbi:hypothetical protein [Desulfosporosinus burensis]